MTKDKKQSMEPANEAPQPAPITINAPPQQAWGVSNILTLAGFLLTFAVIMGGLVVWLTERTLDEHSAKMEVRLLQMENSLASQIKDSFQSLDK